MTFSLIGESPVNTVSVQGSKTLRIPKDCRLPRVPSRRVVLFLLCVCCTLMLWGCVSSAYQPFGLLSWNDLVYPEDAKEAKITGTVTVQYDILIDGTVTNVLVIRSEPAEIFDSEAIRHVQSWVFRPARMNGVPQETKNVESDIEFKLSELMDDPPVY